MAVEKEKKKITFKYVHPDNLRDLFVSGVWGGFTGRKEIHMHFFSERQPIPKFVTHEMKDALTLGDLIKQETGGDVVRLIQTSIVMDIDTAVATRDWLTKMIEAVGKKGDNE